MTHSGPLAYGLLGDPLCWGNVAMLLALAAPDPAPETEEAGLAQKLLAGFGLTHESLARARAQLEQRRQRDATGSPWARP